MTPKPEVFPKIPNLKYPQPKVTTQAVAPYQQTQGTDLGGPRPDGNDEGEDNPGAKAAAPVTPVSGDPQQRAGESTGMNATPTVDSKVAYGTSEGPDVTYPIKPSYEELDLSSDVAALTEGEELSEEFKEKAKTIFEAAVKSKLNEEAVKLQEQFEERLQKEIEKMKKEISEEVNGTINYVVNKWVEDNQVSVDRSIRNEITEDFIAGFMNLCKEHWINIPEEKTDIVEEMSEQLCEMEARLNEQIERNVELNSRLNESSKKVILNKISEGLADTQKDKLASLAEGVEFESAEKFAEKVKTLRESYFPNSVTKNEVSDETPVEDQEMSPVMAAYLQAISRWK